ncbi:MAG TPA: integration host factor subunit alpha [Syntrophales bacterium]|nr:integration host factor subunit alpha [Syntrophales bacterium]
MTKADIVGIVDKRLNLNKKECYKLVESVFEIIKDTLGRGENLKISGFGQFIIRQKADRRGRNPQTGESITIEARRIVTYKPSPVLNQFLNSKS